MIYELSLNITYQQYNLRRARLTLFGLIIPHQSHYLASLAHE